MTRDWLSVSGLCSTSGKRGLLAREEGVRSLVSESMRYRTYKNTDLAVREIVFFVGSLDACLNGSEGSVAFSIAT